MASKWNSIVCNIFGTLKCYSTFKSDRTKVMKSHCFVNIVAPFLQYIHASIVVAFHVIHYLHNLHFVRLLALYLSWLFTLYRSSWFHTIMFDLRNLVIFQPNYKFFAIIFPFLLLKFCVVFSSVAIWKWM